MNNIIKNRRLQLVTAIAITMVVTVPLGMFAGFALGASYKVTQGFEQRLIEFAEIYSYRRRASEAQVDDLVEMFDLQLGYAVLELRRYWPYLEPGQREDATRLLIKIRKDQIFETKSGELGREVQRAFDELRVSRDDSG